MFVPLRDPVQALSCRTFCSISVLEQRKSMLSLGSWPRGAAGVLILHLVGDSGVVGGISQA